MQSYSFVNFFSLRLYDLQYCLMTPHTKSQTITIISMPASSLQRSQHPSYSTPTNSVVWIWPPIVLLLDLGWLLYCISLSLTREIILDPSISVSSDFTQHNVQLYTGDLVHQQEQVSSIHVVANCIMLLFLKAA